jgi:hypothetical protein
MLNQIENLLRERIITPLMTNDVVRGSVEAFQFDADTVVEAKLWGLIRRVADRGIDACQAREKSKRELHVA